MRTCKHLNLWALSMNLKHFASNCFGQRPRVSQNTGGAAPEESVLHMAGGTSCRRCIHTLQDSPEAGAPGRWSAGGVPWVLRLLYQGKAFVCQELGALSMLLDSRRFLWFLTCGDCWGYHLSVPSSQDRPLRLSIRFPPQQALGHPQTTCRNVGYYIGFSMF